MKPYDISAVSYTHLKSLGHFYMYMTYVCGFQYCQEGKTMGLAPYGCDRFVERICQHIDYSKYDFMNSTIVDEIKLILQETKQEPTFQVKADLACMAQIILQKYTFMLLNDLYAEYPSKNLCLSGGVVLNSAMNGLIKQHTPFDNVYIYPAAGDAGTAVGAALYVYHQTEKEKKQHVLSVPSAVFSGTSYTQAQIAVSYTHLDVYKRQVVDSAWIRDSKGYWDVS